MKTSLSGKNENKCYRPSALNFEYVHFFNFIFSFDCSFFYRRKKKRGPGGEAAVFKKKFSYVLNNFPVAIGKIEMDMNLL